MYPQQGTVFQGQQSPRMKINMLVIQETGTYNPMFRRPYETVADGNVVKMFSQQLEGAADITPALVAGITNEFIKPTAAPEKKIVLPGEDWDRPRLQFFMEVSYTDPLGGELIEYVQGHSEYFGLSPVTSAIDPQMKFFVNSVSKMRVNNYPTPFGNQQTGSIIDSSHVLMSQDFNSVLNQHDTRMRPQDIFTTMTRSHIKPKHGTLVDSRTSLMNAPLMSRRTNALTTNYVADVLRGYKHAQTNDQYGQAEAEVLTTARGNVAETLSSRDFFLMSLQNVEGHGPISNWFTYNDLLQMDSTLPQRTFKTKLGITEKAQMSHAGLTAHWDGRDIMTVKAVELSQQVPALMMECGLQVLTLISSNDYPDTQPRTSVQDVDSIAKGMDLDGPGHRFIHDFNTKILRDWSFNNQVRFNVLMECDLFGETRLRLSFNGEPPTDFVTPSFCDALMVPVLTGNTQHALDVANDFYTLTSIVKNDESYGTSMMPNSLINSNW